MEETKQQPLGLRVCAELAGSFLLCFAIYAFSTWGSAVYGVNVVFMAVATGLAYAVSHRHLLPHFRRTVQPGRDCGRRTGFQDQAG